MVGNAEALAGGAQGCAVGFELAQIFLPRGSRIEIENTTGLEIAEHGRLLEAKGQFSRIEDLEDDYFMDTSSERDEVGFEVFDGSEEIGEQHHEAAFADDFDDALEGRGQIRGLSAGRFLQREHDMPEMAGAMAGREVLADLFVEGEQADGVALQIKKIGEGGSEGSGVLGLGVAERTVSHGAAAIGEEVAAEIGFVLEFLDEIAVTAGEDAPIQVA